MADDLTAERDEARNVAARWCHDAGVENARADAAEAEVTRLREALAEIAGVPHVGASTAINGRDNGALAKIWEHPGDDVFDQPAFTDRIREAREEVIARANGYLYPEHAEALDRLIASVRAAVLAEVENEAVALVAALSGAIEQIKAHGGEPSHNAITIRDQVIARIRNGGAA